MRRIFLLICLAAFSGCTAPQTKPVALLKANVLPLALSDAFAFKKTKLYLDEDTPLRSSNEMVSFQQRRAEFGAVDNLDKNERKGNYFTFYWKASRPAAITVRLEYRTANLADYVQAQEVTYPYAKGSHETHFQVTGDNYYEDGRITAWRALLIEDDRIVALNQSMLWN